MQDKDKTKEQLIEELALLRRRNAELMKISSDEGWKLPDNELGAGQNILDTIIDTAPICIKLITADGSLQSMNRTGLDMIEADSLDQVKGQCVYPLVSEEYRDAFKDMTGKVFEGRSGTLEFKMVGLKGRPLWLYTHAVPLCNDKKEVVFELATTINITERKKAEEALQESEARYRSIYDNIGIGIALIGKDMEILELNPKMLKWFPHIDSNRRGICYRSFNVPPGDKVCDYCPTVHTLKDGQVHAAVTNTPSEGGMRNYQIIATPLRGADGSIVASIEMVEDITGRMQSETVLKKREKQLAESQRIAHIGSWEHNLKTGQVFWSDELFRLLGLDPETDKADFKMFFEMVHPEDQSALKNAINETLRDKKPFSVDYRFVLGDGTTRIIHAQAELIRNDEGDLVILSGTGQDVTDRKLMEERLANSERLYRLLVETIYAVAWEVDVTSQRFTYISPQVKTMLGYPQEGWKDFAFWADHVHPEDREFAIGFCLAETAKGKDHEFEYRMIAADGRTVWIRDVVSVITEEERPVTLRGYFLDITSMKLAEERILRSEEFIRNILDTVDEGFIVVDHDYRIMTANKAYCDQVGRIDHEIVGRYCYEISHHTSRPCYEEGEECAVRKVFATGKPCIAMHRHKGREGDILYVETKAFPVKDNAGNVISVIETINDITEKHLLEEERLKTQKLEAVGTLAGGIAHDFNNLLQGIFGHMSMARITMDDKDRALAMLNQAERALHVAVNLTTQLLTFSKGGKPVTKITSLKSLIENSVKFALSGSRVDYRINLDDDLWPVEADEGQIGQVIQNIVLNADQAMPEGGTIAITAKNVLSSGKRLPRLPREGKYIEISIKDSGIGIPEGYLQKIFDPYFTTKEKGSGLGLATSHSIIRNHGGVIDVTSEPGKGTTVVICLPAADEKVLPEKAREKTEGLWKGKGRLLVMDDEEIIRTVAGHMIRSLGYEADFAENGEEAIEKYAAAMREGQPFVAVILDLTVRGGMGGMETIKEIAALDPEVKAIVSSGYSEDTVLANYEKYGFKAILSKPYEVDELGRVLYSLVSNR